MFDHYFFDVYIDSKKHKTEKVTSNGSEHSYNKTETYPQPLKNNKAASKLCNYFDTSQSWKNFLIFNFIFLYILPVLLMTTAYGLIIRKVRNKFYVPLFCLLRANLFVELF